MTPREQQLTSELEQCQEQLAAARREITLLRQKLDTLARRIFGVSSEALNPAQLQLLLQMPELQTAENPPAPVERPKPMVAVRKHRASRLPENLPVVEEVIDPEPVKAQPENWRCIGQEVSDQLDYEPGRFLRRRTIRRKYVHRIRADAVPIIAPLPASLQERGLAAPGLLAHVLVSKYCDHLPLYRQEQIFAQRYKINLPRQTLARWVELAADWLKPIYEHIRTGVMAGGYVQVDETPINYLEPGNGKTKQGYLWTGSRPGGDVFFRWETSRAAASLNNLIPVNFTGTIQCDGYGAYRSFAAGRKGSVALAGCWAHVRRKFFEALESSPRTAAWILRQRNCATVRSIGIHRGMHGSTQSDGVEASVQPHHRAGDAGGDPNREDQSGRKDRSLAGRAPESARAISNAYNTATDAIYHIVDYVFVSCAFLSLQLVA